MKWTPHENLNKEMTSKEKFGDMPHRMDFVRTNQYLQDLKRVFDKLGIRFFLCWGTLVGAIRDHDFSWLDSDSDVGIFYEDADKLSEIHQPFKDLGYYRCFGGRIDNKYMSGYIAKKEFREKVDFHTLILFNGERCMYRYSRNDLDYYIPYPKKYFENLKEIEFKGEKYLVPNPPEEFLTYLWGNWKIPHGGQFGKPKMISVPRGTLRQGGSI